MLLKQGKELCKLGRKGFSGQERIFNGILSFDVSPSANILQKKDLNLKVFRIQAYDSIMFGYFSIAFIYIMFAVKVWQTFQIHFRKANLKKKKEKLQHQVNLIESEK